MRYGEIELRCEFFVKDSEIFFFLNEEGKEVICPVFPLVKRHSIGGK